VSSTPQFRYVGERLWLDFVNTGHSRGGELLGDFEALIQWIEAAGELDVERAQGLRRRAQQQPAGAAATLVDARRIRSALRTLAEHGARSERVRLDALAEINRVLGRSAGMRRIERRADGAFARTFVSVGDAFAGLMIPIVDSAADSLIDQELGRVRHCADTRCSNVFLDGTRNGRRRWCDMRTCGNRAKASRFRRRLKQTATVG
jgi:predicted RNA-binding Zn ribbon-like protein